MVFLQQIAFINVLVYFWIMRWTSSSPVDLTLGFTELPLNASNFEIQKPYNLPVSARYKFADGVHKLWVYSTDKPLSKSSKTNPRTEIRITGYDYSSGVWQFEGHGYVPSGSSGFCTMQVFGATAPRATTLMLVTVNGSLSYYRTPILVPYIWDRWFRLNVIHDVDASNVKVHVDGILLYQARGHGGASHYFKCGVYSQNDASYYMESRWKRIRVFRKCS